MAAQVNKYVFDPSVQERSAVSGAGLRRPDSIAMRLLRAGLIATAIGASAIAMGFAAQADTPVAAQR